MILDLNKSFASFHAVVQENRRCRCLVLELILLFDILRDRLALSSMSFEVGLTVSFNGLVGHCRFSSRYGSATMWDILQCQIRARANMTCLSRRNLSHVGTRGDVTEK